MFPCWVEWDVHLQVQNILDDSTLLRCISVMTDSSSGSSSLFHNRHLAGPAVCLARQAYCLTCTVLRSGRTSRWQEPRARCSIQSWQSLKRSLWKIYISVYNNVTLYYIYKHKIHNICIYRIYVYRYIYLHII